MQRYNFEQSKCSICVDDFYDSSVEEFNKNHPEFFTSEDRTRLATEYSHKYTDMLINTYENAKNQVLKTLCITFYDSEDNNLFLCSTHFNKIYNEFMRLSDAY